MKNPIDESGSIVRTEQGLTIADTRITIYDIMDHLAAGWTPKLILNWLPLTEQQLEEALSYIDANRVAVETEYQEILQTNREIREYWDDRNRERLAQIAAQSPKSGREDVYAKLQAWKAKLGLTR